MMEEIKQKLEQIKIEFVKIHLQKNYRTRIEGLEIIRIIIEEVTNIIDNSEKEYHLYYQVLLINLELALKSVEEMLYLDEAENVVEYLENVLGDMLIFCAMYDLIEEEQENSEDIFLKQVENMENMIDEYKLRKEKK